MESVLFPVVIICTVLEEIGCVEPAAVKEQRKMFDFWLEFRMWFPLGLSQESSVPVG